MIWHLSHRADADVRPLADRHYNRQKIGAKHFAPPGRCLVLKTESLDAYWITSFPYAEYVRHAWAGAWVCSAFRNESSILSSDLIRDALSASRWKWGDPPELGMITFVNESKIKSTNPGFCYLKAGFQKVGRTKGGLLALQIKVGDMPSAEAPHGVSFRDEEVFAVQQFLPLWGAA